MNQLLQIAGLIIFVIVAVSAFFTLLSILPDLLTILVCGAILYLLYRGMRGAGVVP
jgi:threonine/homoserine/homoserine lactone efflux protein